MATKMVTTWRVVIPARTFLKYPPPILLRASGMLILWTSKQITKAQTNHCCCLPFTFHTRPDWLFPCTVEPQYNEGWRDQQNLFTLTRFPYIKVLFHKFYYYWGKENCMLQRGPRYIELKIFKLINFLTQKVIPEIFLVFTILS